MYGLYYGDERMFLGESLIFERTFPVKNGLFGPYPYWTNIFYSFYFILSGFPAVNAYILLRFFLFIPVLAFYLFASTFFKQNKRTAVVGTFFFTLFAGFGWLEVLDLKWGFSTKFQNIPQLINYASDKTYDLKNVASQFGYFLDTPETIVGLSCFLVLFYLVRREWKTKSLSYLLLTIIITLDYVAHNGYEAMIFVGLFTLYQLISKEKTESEYQKMGLAVLIGLLTPGFIDFISPGATFTINRAGLPMRGISYIATCSILIFGIILSLFKEKIKRTFMLFYQKILSSEKLRIFLAFIIIFIYGLCYIIYFTTFQTLVPFYQIVYTNNPWPWFIYPVRFGIVGLLALTGLVFYLLSDKNKDNTSIIILSIWAFIILMACWIGHSIWFLQLKVQSLIVENKLQKYLWIPLCLLASYSLINFFEKFKPTNIRPLKLESKQLIGGLIISGIIITGVTSRLFETEFYTLVGLSRKISTEEFSALEYLNNVRSPNISVATVTSSSLLHDYAGIPTERIFDRWWDPLLYDINSLEACMNLLFSYNIRYLYLASRDHYYINRYASSYVFDHLIKNLPVVFRNSEVQIYEFPKFTPPSATSSLAVAVPTFVNVEQPPKPGENTVALWHFDEGNGEYAKDSSENSNNGKVYNASWVAGKFGSGLLFDGIDTYVDCGNDTSLDITDEITIEAWVKLNADWDSTGIICIKAPGTNWSNANWYLRVEPTREVRFIWGDGSNWKWYQSVPKLEVERWYHLAVEWDKIFINGEEVATTESGTATSHTINIYDVCIGASSPKTGVFNGVIDELHILNNSILKNIDVERVFDYYYPIEIVALSNLNYTIISKEDYDFHTYSTIIITDSNVANVASFLEWVETGKTLVILNPYDFGSFANLFIESHENDTLTSNGIQGRHFTLSIPNILIHKIKPLENVQIISNYTNNNNQTSPFSLLKPVGQGKIIYVYLEPYLNSLQETDNYTNRQTLFSKLKYIPSILELTVPGYRDTLNRSIYPPSDTHVAIAKEANFTGNINLQFDAFTISQTGNLYAKRIKYNKIFKNNVSILNIKVFGPTLSTINGRGGKILDGSWNYAIVRLTDNFDWTIHVPTESKVKVRLVTKNDISTISVENDTFQIIDIRSKPNINSTEILMKNLHLYIDGEMHFEKFYHKFPFWINQNGKRVVPYSDGDYISFRGNIELPVYSINTKTLYISNFYLNGDWGTPQILQPVQIVSWKRIITSPFLLMLILIDITYILYIKAQN
ncbi:MAG: LamG domain-containing protein [Candidatus Odinarchaeia archaeon]